MGNTKYINDFEQSKALFEKYKKVVSVEIDAKMVNILGKTMAG